MQGWWWRWGGLGVKVNNGITGLHLGLKYFIGRHGSLQYWIMITAIKYINLAKKEVQKKAAILIICCPAV